MVQDVRGRNASEGEWLPNYHEVEDGDDTLNWIASQPWCSGRIGMVGGSYLGYVQWAAAASGNPHLKALISVVCAGSSFVDLPRRGGSFTSGMLAWAFAVSQKTFHPELMERDDWEEVLNIRPLTDLPKKALGYDVPFITRWLEPSDYNDFWRQSNWQERSAGAQIPALIQSGWFDDNGMGTTEALELVHDFPRGMRKVILGPWQHSGNSKYDMHGVSFGSQALRFDLDWLYFRWFEHHLKEVDNGIDQTAPVEYYTLGQEVWKTAENWPVPETRVTQLYLDSDGHANTSAGDGRLTFARPEQENSDGYAYDPEHPSVHIIDMSENEIEVPERLHPGGTAPGPAVLHLPRAGGGPGPDRRYDGGTVHFFRRDGHRLCGACYRRGREWPFHQAGGRPAQRPLPQRLCPVGIFAGRRDRLPEDPHHQAVQLFPERSPHPGDHHLQRQEFHLPQQQHTGGFCFRPDRGGP